MTFPLRHILFLSFVGLSVPHISSRSSGNCRCSVGPGFFRFGCQNEARSLSNRRLGKSKEGAGGGCSRLRRSTDDRGQRAAAAVESRVREQFVSQSHGPDADGGGRRRTLMAAEFTRPPPTATGRPVPCSARTALLSRKSFPPDERNERRSREERNEGTNRGALSRDSHNNQIEKEGSGVISFPRCKKPPRRRPCRIIISRTSRESRGQGRRRRVGGRGRTAGKNSLLLLTAV